ncbi:MAG: hypothetical protein UR94_C0008G0005 [Parcubacteria group bacterium GW2011_GWA2_36_10]|nr:MAG: hypothetical protein UR94_C0008G0005 [Parcubacteria group bacterium GW2011_GWA2_36_10]
MSNIITKSGIIAWDVKNIDTVPEEMGIYILRTSPIIDDIIFISGTDNLRKELQNKYNDDSLKDVKFFDWYIIKDKSDIEKLENQWRARYINV